MPPLGRWRQEDLEFKVILSYSVLDQAGVQEILSVKKEKERGDGEGENSP